MALAFLAPHIVKLALVFGPREYFALMVLAFVTVSAAFGDSTLKGMTSLFLGLGLAVVGIDGLTGQERMSFGVPQLLDGVEVTTLAGYRIAPVVVGLILGPMAEAQLRRALAIAQGDISTLVSTPLSATLLVIAALAFLVPMLLRLRGRGQVLAQFGGDDD